LKVYKYSKLGRGYAGYGFWLGTSRSQKFAGESSIFIKKKLRTKKQVDGG
jgi:hypothetical protein